MRISDIVYFAPNVRLKELDLSDKDTLINAFEKRVRGFYLEPIKELNDKKMAFAAGIIEFSMIDALARYSDNYISKGKEKAGKRIVKMLSHIFQVKKEIAQKTYNDFRNGLLHENHIGNCGCFDYNSSKSLSLEQECVIVNPLKFQEEFEEYFEKYLEELKTDTITYNKFFSNIKVDFGEEIKYFQKEE